MVKSDGITFEIEVRHLNSAKIKNGSTVCPPEDEFVLHRFKGHFASAIEDIVKNLEKIGFSSVKNFAIRLRQPGRGLKEILINQKNLQYINLEN